MWSATTSRERRRKPSTCCTGTRTRPTCRDRCMRGTCATSISRTVFVCPDRLTMCGASVDLGKIDMPSYVLATQEDHIVPWRSAYRTTQLVRGKTQFVLGASGHIAGVINPASKNKRSYWTDGTLGDDPEQWLASAKAAQGSWWTHWMRWLKPQAGKGVAARTRLGNAKHKPIEPAPGRYVKGTGRLIAFAALAAAPPRKLRARVVDASAAEGKASRAGPDGRHPTMPHTPTMRSTAPPTVHRLKALIDARALAVWSVVAVLLVTALRDCRASGGAACGATELARDRAASSRPDRNRPRRPACALRLPAIAAGNGAKCAEAARLACGCPAAR